MLAVGRTTERVDLGGRGGFEVEVRIANLDLEADELVLGLSPTGSGGSEALRGESGDYKRLTGVS